MKIYYNFAIQSTLILKLNFMKNLILKNDVKISLIVTISSFLFLLISLFGIKTEENARNIKRTGDFGPADLGLNALLRFWAID